MINRASDGCAKSAEHAARHRRPICDRHDLLHVWWLLGVPPSTAVGVSATPYRRQNDDKKER
jgi:hypothetical protein